MKHTGLDFGQSTLDVCSCGRSMTAAFEVFCHLRYVDARLERAPRDLDVMIVLFDEYQRHLVPVNRRNDVNEISIIVAAIAGSLAIRQCKCGPHQAILLL